MHKSKWIRAQHGSKSVSLGNIVEGYNNADGPGLLQEFAKRLLIEVKLGTEGIVDKTVLVAVLTRKDGRPGGSANGIRHQATVKEHALRGNPVNVGSRCNQRQSASVGANGLIGVIIADNEDDIGSLRTLFRFFLIFGFPAGCQQTEP